MTLALMQWQSAQILQSSLLRLAGVKAYASMNDVGMDFIYNPEVQTSKSGLSLTLSEAASVFGTTINDPDVHSLLNPDVMFKFYYMYSFDTTANIASYLEINPDMVKPLKEYCDWLAGINVSTVYGTAIAKTMEAGLNILRKTLPI